MNTKELAKKIRLLTLQIIFKAKASHMGSAFSIVDILSVLFSSFIKKNIFILSKGHACSALYVTLYLKKYFTKKKLFSFGKNKSLLMTHASHKVSGVEFSTGSLGHGLSFAVGKALAYKIKKKLKKVYVLLSDGELNEGSVWEALLFASHHKLDNLIIIIDYNKIQGLGFLKDILNMEPLEKKFESFGCNVKRIDGHNHNHLKLALTRINKKKPLIILADTIKGKGIKELENSVASHYKSPSIKEFNLYKKEIINA